MSLSATSISAMFKQVEAQRVSRFPQAQEAKNKLPKFLQEFVDQEYKSSGFDKSYFVTVVDAAQDANDLVTLLLGDSKTYAAYKAIPSTEPNINYPKANHIKRLIGTRDEEMLYCGMTYSLAERYLAHVESQAK